MPSPRMTAHHYLSPRTKERNEQVSRRPVGSKGTLNTLERLPFNVFNFNKGDIPEEQFNTLSSFGDLDHFAQSPVALPDSSKTFQKPKSPRMKRRSIAATPDSDSSSYSNPFKPQKPVGRAPSATIVEPLSTGATARSSSKSHPNIPRVVDGKKIVKSVGTGLPLAGEAGPGSVMLVDEDGRVSFWRADRGITSLPTRAAGPRKSK